MSAATNTTTLNIEEIVKFQQELLNQQRNQKAIQKETIKLMTNLNKNIMFMSDRLDQFAQRANIKLEDGLQHQQQQQHEYFDEAMLLDDKEMAHLSEVIQLPSTTADGTSIIYVTTAQAATPLLSNHQVITTAQQQTSAPTKRSSSGSKLNKINTILSQQAAAANTTSFTANTINQQQQQARLAIVHAAQAAARQQHQSSKLLDTTNTTINGRSIILDGSLGDLSYSGEDGDENDMSDNEIETAIQMKNKKAKRRGSPASSSAAAKVDSATAIKMKESEESNNQQRLFNKYVRECVEKRLGDDYLLLHEIQEIDQNIMEEVKKDALSVYPPIHIRPRRAWHLAKASLRCRRRSLRRQKEKQCSQTATTSTTAITTSETASTTSTEINDTTNLATATTISISN